MKSVAMFFLIVLYAGVSLSDQCVWTIGGNYSRREQIRDTYINHWTQNTNNGDASVMYSSWSNVFHEDWIIVTSLVQHWDSLYEEWIGDFISDPITLPEWDALTCDDCSNYDDTTYSGDSLTRVIQTCGEFPWLHRTTHSIALLWFDMTNIPYYVSMDSAICSLYVDEFSYIWPPPLVPGYMTCAIEDSVRTQDVISDTINQDWVEGATIINETDPRRDHFADWNDRGYPYLELPGSRYRSTTGDVWSGTVWEPCDSSDEDWDGSQQDGCFRPHSPTPMSWLGAGSDTVHFQSESGTNHVIYQRYVGWDVTPIANAMYQRQAGDTSVHAFGIALYDTLFYSYPDTVFRSANTHVQFRTREDADQYRPDNGHAPKLVLWYTCNPPITPVDTLDDAQIIYIND